MARGGRGGKRGGNRGRSPGAGFAQSGGKATTFQGTSGGGAYGNTSGGSHGQRAKDVGRLANGQPYKVRGPGGDKTLTRGGLPGTPPANLRALSGSSATVPRKTLRGGAARGKGGSNQ
jgi:hypothetical protein